MTTIFPRRAPRDLLEGTPLVATPAQRPAYAVGDRVTSGGATYVCTHAGEATPRRPKPLAMVELDRCGMLRVAKAALLMVERSGMSRRAAAEKHGFSQGTIAGLIRLDTPWQLSADVIARIEQALGIQPGDVLAGRAPEPAGQVGRTIRRCV